MAFFHQVQGVAFSIDNDNPDELETQIESDERFKDLKARVEANNFTIGTNISEDEGSLTLFVGKATLADTNTYVGKTVVARLATNEEMNIARIYAAELATILAEYGDADMEEGFVLAQWD